MTTSQWEKVSEFKMKVRISFLEDAPVHTHATRLGKIHLCKGMATEWFDVDESDEHDPVYTSQGYNMPKVTSLCGLFKDKQSYVCEKSHPEGWEDNLCLRCKAKQVTDA